MSRQGSTNDRGYGTAHQRIRRQVYEPQVNAGRGWCAELICLMPSRWIAPGSKWDLAHDRRNPGRYLGPAHEKCNRAEGARFVNGKKTAKRRRWEL